MKNKSMRINIPLVYIELRIFNTIGVTPNTNDNSKKPTNLP